MQTKEHDFGPSLQLAWHTAISGNMQRQITQERANKSQGEWAKGQIV